MKSETLLEFLRLALRLTEVILNRRPSKTSVRASNSAAPLAVGTDSSTAAASSTAPRRRNRLAAGALAGPTLVGALAAGAAAYVIVQQQRRVRDRYRALAAQFAYELLDVLAAPGGGARLTYGEMGLTESATGAVYPVVDGIPDFSLASAAREEKPALDEWGTLRELAAPLGPALLGANRAGNAALAAAAAAAAGNGWALSVPCGMGDLEIEMARANPRARILCLHAQWNTLLETRRRAREEKLDNLYFARGSAILLPVQDKSVAAVWSADGFHRYTAPELAMTQIARALKPGGLMGGVSLVKGGPGYVEQLIEMSRQRLPGRRDEARHLQLLAASGFGEVHAYRDGGYLRFTAWRE